MLCNLAVSATAASAKCDALRGHDAHERMNCREELPCHGQRCLVDLGNNGSQKSQLGAVRQTDRHGIVRVWDLSGCLPVNQRSNEPVGIGGVEDQSLPQAQTEAVDGFANFVRFSRNSTSWRRSLL